MSASRKRGMLDRMKQELAESDERKRPQQTEAPTDDARSKQQTEAASSKHQQQPQTVDASSVRRPQTPDTDVSSKRKRKPQVVENDLLNVTLSAQERFEETHKRATFWLPRELLDALDAFCEEKGIPKAEVVRRGVEYFLQNSNVKKG